MASITRPSEYIRLVQGAAIASPIFTTNLTLCSLVFLDKLDWSQSEMEHPTAMPISYICCSALFLFCRKKGKTVQAQKNLAFRKRAEDWRGQNRNGECIHSREAKLPYALISSPFAPSSAFSCTPKVAFGPLASAPAHLIAHKCAAILTRQNDQISCPWPLCTAQLSSISPFLF